MYCDKDECLILILWDYGFNFVLQYLCIDSCKVLIILDLSSFKRFCIMKLISTILDILSRQFNFYYIRDDNYENTIFYK